MKHLLIFSLFIWSSTLLQAQNDAISRFFSKYAEDERFTTVFISPKLFQMVAKIAVDDPEWEQYREVIKDLGGLRILTSDSIPNAMKLYQEIYQRLPTKEYEELLTVRDGEEHVRFMIRQTDEVISELLLLVATPDDFTMISFLGKIDLGKISSLAKSMDIEGIEHLEKIKN
jgi:hypothetical protein